MIKQTTFKLTKEDADALFRVRRIATAICQAKYGDESGFYLSDGDLKVLENIGYGHEDKTRNGMNLMNGWKENPYIKFEHAEMEDKK